MLQELAPKTAALFADEGKCSGRRVEDAKTVNRSCSPALDGYGTWSEIGIGRKHMLTYVYFFYAEIKLEAGLAQCGEVADRRGAGSTGSPASTAAAALDAV